MSLRDPEARRALRSIVQAIVALLVIGMVFWLIDLLRNNAASLTEIARFALGIVLLGTLGYIMENVTRAFNFKLGPTGAEFSSGASEAAQTVADAAVQKADQISAVTP